MLGFWIFMLLFNLMLPLTMIGFGRHFHNQTPDNINSVFGYRTRRSMRNRETWQFAHKHIGRTWQTLGLGLLILSVIAMAFLFGREKELVGRMGSLITGIQVILMIGSIIPTELALSRAFDEKGNPRSYSDFND